MSCRSEERASLSQADTAIPRSIIQLWAQRATLDSRIADNISRLLAQNPGWTHVLYQDRDAEDLIATAYGVGMVAALRRIDPRYGAARADLMRYLMIHNSGGIYLDAKIGRAHV